MKKLSRNGEFDFKNQIQLASPFVLQNKKARVLHLGPGRFHRAHQCVYFQDYMERFQKAFGCVDVSLRSSATIADLKAQDCLFALRESSADGQSLRLVASIVDALSLPEDFLQLKELLQLGELQFLTLTITEKAYAFASFDNPEIQWDLKRANTESPKSIYGFLEFCAEYSKKPLIVIPCDNLLQNGKRLEKSFQEFCDLREKKISKKIFFASSVVDRIVPATEEAEFEIFDRESGIKDPAFVVSENFREWIIEWPKEWPQEIPKEVVSELSEIGIQAVQDIQIYEDRKLRILNACHSFVAYTGWFLGYRSVDQALTSPLILSALKQLFFNELLLTFSSEVDAEDYFEKIIRRFQNLHLKHSLAQIATDGSQKIQQRWIPSLLKIRALKKDHPLLTYAFALWLFWMTRGSFNSEEIPVSDPWKGKSLESLKAIFPDKLLYDKLFMENLQQCLEGIQSRGPEQALRNYQARGQEF